MKKTKIIFSLFFFLALINISAQTAFEVEKTGEGPAVILLPGFACTRQVFDEITTQLSKTHEVHAFTFAGFGGVPPISFPWLPKVKSAIENYVKENKLQNPILIGHSLGGTLALWLASESSTYSKIIVIDALPAMGALMMPDFDSETVVYNNPHNTHVLEMDEATFRDMANQTAAFMTTNVEKQQLISNWIQISDRETYVYGYTDLLRLDLRKAIANIQAPVHILAAALPYGKEVAEINYRKQYENLSQYNLKFAENSGHFIMFDQPQWLMDEIQTLLGPNE